MKLLGLGVVLIVLGGTLHAGESRRVDYSRDIRPILARSCFACHGPDEGTRESGLRLDHPASAMSLLDSGSHAVVAGEPEISELLVRLVTDDNSLKMPPVETGKSLSNEQIDLVRLWISQGASYTDHWSFRPIQDPALPQVANADWLRNGIDNFVLARIEHEGLKPSSEADRSALIRRLSFDLVGLPPTIEAVNRFVNDPRPDAYEQLVDELLASPHFGERWGRHWLDLARYADSNGYLGDELRPEAYRYRDWVIDAVNRDLPYRQFTLEQIAGDLLPDSTREQRIATGFLRHSMKNTEAGADRELDRVIQTVDRISTVGTAWLGLTVGCAECHTHKFDPLTHQEFFQLYAFFDNVEEDNFKIGMQEPAPESEASRLKREKELAALTEKLTESSSANGVNNKQLEVALATLAIPKSERSESESEALDHWRGDLSSAAKKLASQYEKLALSQPRAKPILAMAIRETDKRRKTFIHHRGDFRQPGDLVSPETPAFLPPLDARGNSPDRLDLAEWLTRDDHPLTSRTAVNHVWIHLFGRGLVDTADNLGIAGNSPSHPELLDWTARRFLESNGSRKALIRLIVTSSTYRQSSRLTPELAEIDPANELLARQGRFRLEGELIRDRALAASGLLSRKIGGPSIRPPMTSRIAQVSRNQDWKVSEGEDRYRRGMYILFRRATPFPMLTIFDAPDSTVACAQRVRSNSPLQSLTLLNDPVFFECAQRLGRELATHNEWSTKEWLTIAVEQTLAREATGPEIERLELFCEQQSSLISSLSEKELKALVGPGVAAADLQETTLRVMVVRGLLNLDEFVTRE